MEWQVIFSVAKCNNIRWRSLERREPLQEIIKLTFPAVQTICNNLVNSDSIEAAEMLKLALKIYHSGIQVSLWWS